MRTPHGKQHPKLIDLGGCFSWGVLFPRAHNLETTHKEEPSGEGGFLRSIWGDRNAYIYISGIIARRVALGSATMWDTVLPLLPSHLLHSTRWSDRYVNMYISATIALSVVLGSATMLDAFGIYTFLPLLPSDLQMCDSVTLIYSAVHVGVAYIPMGWLRLVDSLKLYVFFAKEPYKRHDILQKETYICKVYMEWRMCLYVYCGGGVHT